jgi:hypothetical protein
MVVEPSFSGQELGSDEIWKQQHYPLLLAKIYQCSNNISLNLVQPHITLLPLLLPVVTNRTCCTIASQV